MRHSLLVVAFFFVAGWAHDVSAQSDVEKMVAESDPAIQAQIRTTAQAFLSDGNSESEIKTSWKGFQELATLKELATDETELIKQLGIYSVGEQSEKEPKVLEAVFVLQILSFKPSITIRTLAPYLGSDNPQLREFAEIWFQKHDNAGYDSPLLPVNYDDYSSYVSARLSRNEDVPAAFVEYIYAMSPERALLVFYRGNRARDMVPTLKAMSKNLQARRRKIGAVEIPPPQGNGSSGNLARLEAFGRKLADAREKAGVPEQVEIPQPPKPDREILLAAHTVEDAIWLHKNKFDEQFQQALPQAQQQLAKLAEHDQWWARLYVAEIMRRHRELRHADVLDKLRHDYNELVSKAANFESNSAR